MKKFSDLSRNMKNEYMNTKNVETLQLPDMILVRRSNNRLEPVDRVSSDQLLVECGIGRLSYIWWNVYEI